MTKNSLSRLPAFAAVAGFVVVAACSPVREFHGYVPDPKTIEQIEPGVDNRRSVEDMLGTPSAFATFDPEVWYYISSTHEALAFQKPDVVERRVVAIEFDEAGAVKDVRRFTLADGKVIAFADRETPTLGRELTFLEQMFGNIGRFNNQRNTSDRQRPEGSGPRGDRY